jgi:RNA polymerase sigma-70 factor, ECF subfamily
MDEIEKKSDADLVLLTLKNQQYFEHLVNRYEKKLARYVRRLSGLENESIEDILQEVFIKIYVNLNDYDSDFTFSSWVYRITHNETVNYLRKNKKSVIVPLETEDEDSKNLIEVLKSEIDVAQDVSRKDMIDRIRAAIGLLPEKYREILILRYVEDLDYKDISDVLRMPMGTVATTINRAKEKFKQIAEKMHLNS